MYRLRILSLCVSMATIFVYLQWKMTTLNASKRKFKLNSVSEINWTRFPEFRNDVHNDFNFLNAMQEKCLDSHKERKNVTEILERRLPKCLIIGFAKCGTYALRSFLTLHSDIVSPNREIAFFTKYYHKGIDWYRNQMPPSLETDITIEKTPSYILSVQALSRIRSFNASIKLIVIVRDPVIRLQSSYAHAQATSRILNKTFESWLKQKYRIKRVADYATHIGNVYRMFPSSQVIVLQEEHLEADPLSVMRDVVNFLGLCQATTNELLIFNSVKGFYCLNISNPRYHEVVQTLTLDHTNGCLTKSKGRQHPIIDPKLRRQLLANITPYNEKLFTLLGRRFNWTH